MATYDRPYSESRRGRDRDYREREFPSSRRGYRDEDEDDRGPWISRDRDDFERERGAYGSYERGGFRSRDGGPSEEPRESGFRESRRFEQFEDWERPRELREFSGHPSSGRSFGRGGYGGGYSGYGGGSAGSYAGRGPKGYRRSDERLKEEVCEQLTDAPDIDAVEIEVAVQGGEVTLEGSVPTRNMKRAAEDRAEAVSGVQQVHNRLRVESSDEFGRGAAARNDRGDEGQRSDAGRKAH